MHILIVGGTGTGKTTLATRLLPVNGGAFVYDPIGDDRWSQDKNRVFHDQSEFMNKVAGPALVFIDEADTLLSTSGNDKENHWLAVRGRHFGISCVFITQRPAMISPTVRNQAEELYVFRISKRDADLLTDDFVVDLSGASALKRGEYYHVYWTKDGEKIAEKKKLDI